MKTVLELQDQLRTFDTFARTNSDPRSLQSKWSELFDTSLHANEANAFASYYREMRSNTHGSRSRRHSRRRNTRKAMKGGSAPLSYQMVPGANVAVYGRFPVEADTDPATIRDLDVYWQSGLTGTCGSGTAYWPSVPADMGSNKVGGGRRRRRGRTMRRKMRGGNMLESLISRPVLSTVPENLLQIGVHNVQGGVPSMPVPSSPVQHTWQYMSNGTQGLINPGLVTQIDSDMTKLASPAPWQTSA